MGRGVVRKPTSQRMPGKAEQEFKDEAEEKEHSGEMEALKKNRVLGN